MKPEAPATDLLPLTELHQSTRRDVFGRREFLFLAGSSVLLAALPGCGGSGGSGSGVTTTGALAPTGRVAGTVNPAHFGGKSLAVGSSYQADVMVSASGAFATTASSSGAQLLTVSDSAGHLRGLATSLPRSSLTIDATSTAIAMVFMTPGIVTIDPTEAATRLAAIKSLPSFAALSSYLLQNLPSSNIASLIKAGQVTTLKKAVVTDYLTAFPPHAAHAMKAAPHLSPRASQGSGTPDDTNVRVTAAQGTKGASGTPFNLNNEDWRYVTVYRQYLGTIGDELAPYQEATLTGTSNPTFDAGILSGANAVSVGALLTNQIGSAGSGTETLDLTKVGGVASVRYWIIGPGLALIQNQLPASMPESQLSTTSYGLTAFYYLVMPILDFVIGSAVSVKLGPKFIAGYWKTLSTELNLDNLIVNFKSGNASNIEVALIDFVNQVSPSIRDILIYLGGTVTEGTWVDKALKLFESTALAVDGANVAVLIANLQFVPRICHVTVSTLPPGTYNVQDVGTLTGDKLAFPYSINNKGQIAGFIASPGGDAPDGGAFFYDGVKITYLQALIPGAYTSSPLMQLNNNGQLVGIAQFSPSQWNPFIFSNGQVTIINTPSNSIIQYLAINDSGVVVGTYYGPDEIPHGFIYSGGTLTQLSPPNGVPFYATDINNKGVVVGTLGKTLGNGNLPGRVCTYSGGVFTDVDPSTDPNVAHFAFLINDAGRILYRDNATKQLYIFDNGVAALAPLPILPTSINAEGDFVGSQAIYKGENLVELSPLLGAYAGYEISQYMALNDSGQICLTAIDSKTVGTQNVVGLLLTPN